MSVKELVFRRGNSLEIRRTPFGTLTLVAFGKVFDLTVFKNGLHFNLSSAGTEEFLGCAGSTGVFTGLSHIDLLLVFYLGLSVKVYSRLLQKEGRCQPDTAVFPVPGLTGGFPVQVRRICPGPLVFSLFHRNGFYFTKKYIIMIVKISRGVL
jgi:hypothetical protein